MEGMRWSVVGVVVALVATTAATQTHQRVLNRGSVPMRMREGGSLSQKTGAPAHEAAPVITETDLFLRRRQQKSHPHDVQASNKPISSEPRFQTVTETKKPKQTKPKAKPKAPKPEPTKKAKSPSQANKGKQDGPSSNAAPSSPSSREEEWLHSVSADDPNAKYYGNVHVGRVLQARELLTGSMLTVNMTVRGNVDVGGSLTAHLVRANTVTSDLLETGALRSPSGVIMVNGDLTITSSRYIPKQHVGSASALNTPQTTHTYPTVTAASFLAENIVLGGIHQWKLIRHDDFDSQPAAPGWSLMAVSSCSRAQQPQQSDHFLGGHCNIGTGQVSKVFHSLPKHSQVRVTGRYHMIDNWRGETAFLKLGGHISWTRQSHPNPGRHGIDMCGHSSHPESHMSIPVDVVMPHTASFLEVTFGSTGDQAQDPCDRSFGVDDVMVYVK